LSFHNAGQYLLFDDDVEDDDDLAASVKLCVVIEVCVQQCANSSMPQIVEYSFSVKESALVIS
jgi:hypothetical protein